MLARRGFLIFPPAIYGPHEVEVPIGGSLSAGTVAMAVVERPLLRPDGTLSLGPDGAPRTRPALDER